MSTTSSQCDASPRPRSSASSQLNASTSSASTPLRGIRLFRSISRRLSRNRPTSDSSSDLSTSSSASSSGSSDSVFSLAPRLTASTWSSASSLGGSSAEGGSLCGSDGGSLSVKVKRVLSSLGAGLSSRDGKKSPPKSILRAPVATTFVRGLSGLPRRVPARSCDAGCRGEVTLFSR